MLFHSHQDLLDEFTHFLPDQTATGPHSAAGRGFLRRDEKSSGVVTARHIQVDKVLSHCDHFFGVSSCFSSIFQSPLIIGPILWMDVFH